MKIEWWILIFVKFNLEFEYEFSFIIVKTFRIKKKGVINKTASWYILTFCSHDYNFLINISKILILTMYKRYTYINNLSRFIVL